MALYALTDQQWVRLRKLINAYESGNLRFQAPTEWEPNRASAVATYLGSANSQIAAVQKTTVGGQQVMTPGSGQVTRYTFDDNNNLTGAGVDAITAFNVSTTSIAVNSFVTVVRDPYSGYFIITNAFPPSQCTSNLSIGPIVTGQSCDQYGNGGWIDSYLCIPDGNICNYYWSSDPNGCNPTNPSPPPPSPPPTNPYAGDYFFAGSDWP